MTPDRVHVDIQEAENGPVVLMLHGWGSSSALMRPLVDRLAGSARIVSVDFPGHGQSPPPHTAWDIPAHAALVRRLVEDSRRPVILVGHSNGGRVALHLLSEPDPPEAVTALVLIAPSGIRRKRTASTRFKAGLARVLKAPFQVLPGSLRALGVDWLRHSLLWKALSSSDYQALDGVMRETFVKCVNHYVEDRLDRIGVPVLIFRGDGDDAITAEQVDRLVSGLPDAGLYTVPGAGHYAHLDAPDVVTEGIRSFFPAGRTNP
ncbi:MAG: alpha/beta hydrolase [Rhodothermales bacterium]